jgi:hypothetical protein
MMGMLVPETCLGNKTTRTHFVASGWFFAFHCVYDARSHEYHIYRIGFIAVSWV